MNHEDAIDICLVYFRVVLRHNLIPFLLQAILQLGNIQVKIFDLKNRVAELAFRPTDVNPIVGLYYLIHLSIIWFRPVKCQCKMHRPCDPGTFL